MIHRKSGQCEWLEFEQLQPFPQLVHGVFLRSLNMADPKQRTTADQILNIPKSISARQVHGRLVETVTEKSLFLECDALTTNVPGLGLLIQHADCQAALFFDPRHLAIANVHCGWRGSVQNIYAETIIKMGKEWGSRAEELLVCISPSLGPTKAEFVNYRTELPEAFQKFQVTTNYFDFWQISKSQLIEAGIAEKNIEIAGICTFTDQANFFSYRRDKNSQRHGTIISLKR